MKILLTGMSGTGKSTLLRALATEESLNVDLDYGGWMVFSETYGEYAFDIPRLERLFAENPDREIFLAGTAINQRELYPQLDAVIVLTAPLEVMRERILRRENPFGKSEKEWAKIIRDQEEVEPLLIRGADFVCSTVGTVEQTVDRIREYMKGR